MTSAKWTSWTRHLGATEIHGHANACIIARTAGDIGAEAHAEVDFVVHAHTANLRAGGASVLPTVASEEVLLHEHSQARLSSSIVRSSVQAASNSTSILRQKVICQQTLRTPVKPEVKNLHGHTARDAVAPHVRPDAGHAMKGSSPVQHSKVEEMHKSEGSTKRRKCGEAGWLCSSTSGKTAASRGWQ